MPESLYGAPYLCMHRGDLHDALASVLPPEIIQLGKKLVGLEQTRRRSTLAFADGTRAQADAVDRRRRRALGRARHHRSGPDDAAFTGPHRLPRACSRRR